MSRIYKELLQLKKKNHLTEEWAKELNTFFPKKKHKHMKNAQYY